MALLGGSGVPARLRVWVALRQRLHIFKYLAIPAVQRRGACGEAGADDLVELGREGVMVVRQKTRSRAGTPDAGALLFNVLLLSGWGYRVTPGVSPGNSPFEL